MQPFFSPNVYVEQHARLVERAQRARAAYRDVVEAKFVTFFLPVGSTPAVMPLVLYSIISDDCTITNK